MREPRRHTSTGMRKQAKPTPLLWIGDEGERAASLPPPHWCCQSRSYTFGANSLMWNAGVSDSHLFRLPVGAKRSRESLGRVHDCLNTLVSGMGEHSPELCTLAARAAYTTSDVISKQLSSDHESILELRSDIAGLKKESASLRALILGKDKLILRSAADRIEETVVCAILNISRDEMRSRRLFTIDKVQKKLGTRVTLEDESEVTIEQRHVDDMMADLTKYAGPRPVGRGRTQIKKMGDMEAHEDPLPYHDRLGAIADEVFGSDPRTCNDVKAALKAYLAVRKHYHPDLDVSHCDLSVPEDS